MQKEQTDLRKPNSGKNVAKLGVQTAGMIFQTGSGNRADCHIKRILQAGIFIEQLIP